MTETYKKRKTALEIFKSRFQPVYTVSDLPSAKEYYLNLREAVIYELENYGFCYLVDWLIDSPPRSLDPVTLAVFMDISHGYKEKRLADISEGGENEEFVPFVQVAIGNGFSRRYEPLRWIDWNYRQAIPFNNEYPECVRDTRLFVRAEHVNKIKLLSQPVVKSESEEIIQNARNEADDIRKKASEQALTETDNARQQCEEIIKKANEDAAEILSDANTQSNTIIEEAKESARKIVKDAEDKAAETAEKAGDELIEKYIQKNQKQMRKESDHAAQKAINEQLAIKNGMAEVYDSMCQKTNAFQASWVAALDNAVNSLAEIKSDFYKHLHDWQVSLYQSDVQPIAEKYLELYRIINVDRLIAKEITLRNSADNQEEADNGQSEDEVLAGLERINRTLTTFLRRFEVALNGLDLYVFYPEKGKDFDEIRYVSEDDELPHPNAKVAECVLPGIAKKSNDDIEDDVVIRAVVKLEDTENETV